jgi:hypothetical protein
MEPCCRIYRVRDQNVYIHLIVDERRDVRSLFERRLLRDG